MKYVLYSKIFNRLFDRLRVLEAAGFDGFGYHGRMRSITSRFAFALTVCLLGLSSTYADDALDGVYERVSLTNTRTGESPEAANRRGLLIMADGHYSMMTMNPDRRYVPDEDVAAMPVDDQLDYFREWLDINGHTGRFEAGDGKLTWYRDISENPREVGTVSNLGYEWRDGLLVIYFTLPNGDRYDWVWRRVRPTEN